MHKLVCQFTDGVKVIERVFRSWSRIRCLHKAALFQAKHSYAYLSMQYA